MNILINSASKRGKENAFNILSNSNVIKKKEKENKNGINIINGVNNELGEDQKVNFFEKLAMRIIKGVTESKHNLDKNAIEKFAEKINVLES